MKPDRWLATVLFTDIVGSTERAAELGDRRWRELLQRHNAVVRHELARYGGRELNVTGDGFLATFEVPERALRCAWAIRDALRRLGVEVRAGLHTGEVEVVEKTVGGIGVHIGARVGARAGAGEVLVSSTVRDLVSGSGFEFEDRGSHVLKGVPGEWHLFAVTGAPVRLPVAGFWTRAREARLPRVLLLYIAATAVLLWLTAFLDDRLGFPTWTFPAAVLLLLIGLAIISATAWVQAHPLTALRAGAEEVPGSWELDLGEMGKSVARGRLPHLTWSRAILGGVVAFSLLFGVAGLYVLLGGRAGGLGPKPAVAGSAAPGIAVLPFSINDAALERWREGMVDLLATNLDGVAGLRAIDSRTVLASWRGRVRGNELPALETALEVARRTGARYAMIGAAVSSGAGMRLSADVYEVESGDRLGAGQVEGSPDSIFALVDRLSIDVLRSILRGESAALPNVNLARVTTRSLPALKAYLEGEVLFRRSDFDGAAKAYQRAIEADSTFALALYRLSHAYGWSEGVLSELAGEYVDRAARFANRLPEREAQLVRADLALLRGTLDGIPILQQVVRKYPDDAEAWYLLGDSYFHLGPQALIPEEEIDHAFTKALELDLSFAPAYIHLVERAFYAADSASAARLGEAYARLAPGTAFELQHRVAYALAFGDPTARAEARAASDTLSAWTFKAPGDLLENIRFLPLQAELLEAFLRRFEGEGGEAIYPLRELFWNRVKLGRLAEARKVLDDPRLSHRFKLFGLYLLQDTEVGPAAEAAAQALAEESVGENLAHSLIVVGGFAAQRGLWNVHAAAVSQLGKGAEQARGESDTLSARVFSAESLALEAVALWKRGERDRALPALERARREATGHGPLEVVNARIRWWLARLLVEMGQPRDAEPYFRSLPDNHFAAYELAKIYEELGQYQKARDAYALVAEAWRDADPELRPRAEEARAAVARLTSVIREP